MKPLLHLIPYLRPHRGKIVLSILLTLPLAALRFSPAPLVKFLVDDLLTTRDSSKLWVFPALFIGIFLANFVVRFAHYYLQRIVVARVNQALKNDLFEHLSGLSADFFTSQTTGSLMSRIGTDPVYVDEAVQASTGLFREPITFLFLFAYCLSLNWKLTLIAFVVLPPLAFIFSISGKTLKRYIKRLNEETAEIFTVLQESFTGIRMVKLFGLEKTVNLRFQARTGDFAKFLLKLAAIQEASPPTVELITSFAIAGVLGFGGYQVLEGKMSTGDLLAFFAAFGMMINPLRMLNDLNIKLQAGSAACARIFEIFTWKSKIVEARDAQPIHTLQRSIEFKEVHFAYPDHLERAILGGISFSAAKGKTIALVGESGAGKSSLINLIPRVFDVTAGAIEIDGVDIRSLRVPDLRKLIAVVSQDVFLFNDTISENIRMGHLEASKEEIREAARRANALEFISRLPQGFETKIGDRGQKLSGGERQRLSIARAFLRASPLLILDEATSSLDNASEKAVQSALEELMKDRTTLLIAHRLSTVRNADQILVLKKGLICERGTHATLIAMGGEYSRLLRMGGENSIGLETGAPA